MIFVATKNGRQKFFSPSFSAVVRSGYGTDKNQDPGSGINIPVSQHWLDNIFIFYSRVFGFTPSKEILSILKCHGSGTLIEIWICILIQQKPGSGFST
jgi:hypothetical protein